jgi:hypothetical protein
LSFHTICEVAYFETVQVSCIDLTPSKEKVHGFSGINTLYSSCQKKIVKLTILSGHLSVKLKKQLKDSYSSIEGKIGLFHEHHIKDNPVRPNPQLSQILRCSNVFLLSNFTPLASFYCYGIFFRSILTILKAYSEMQRNRKP